MRKGHIFLSFEHYDTLTDDVLVVHSRNFELTHLAASNKCATLAQKMNTVSARRRGDPRTDSQKSRPWGDGKIPASGGGGANLGCAEAEVRHQT
jgi:hypothetical protein